MHRIFLSLKHLRPPPVCLGGILTFFGDDTDIIHPKFKSPEYDSCVDDESPWERVKAIYTLNEQGYVSKELQSILQTGFASAFVGMIWGGMNQSRSAFNNFMNNNQATAFQSNFDAKKKLQYQVTAGFGKGGLRLGWRLALFTTMFCATSTTISVYRGYSSVWEYSAAGLITGAVYRIPLGLKGSLVGGGLGLFLGTIGGVFTYILLRATGTTMEEVRFWQYKFEAARQRALDKAEASSVSRSSIQPLFDGHFEKTQSTNPGIQE